MMSTKIIKNLFLAIISFQKYQKLQSDLISKIQEIKFKSQDAFVYTFVFAVSNFFVEIQALPEFTIFSC